MVEFATLKSKSAALVILPGVFTGTRYSYPSSDAALEGTLFDVRCQYFMFPREKQLTFCLLRGRSKDLLNPSVSDKEQ